MGSVAAASEPFDELGCFSGCLMSSAGIQKLFCGIYSTFKCFFDEFVEEKVFSLSYSSAILAPPRINLFKVMSIHPDSMGNVLQLLSCQNTHYFRAGYLGDPGGGDVVGGGEGEEGSYQERPGRGSSGSEDRLPPGPSPDSAHMLVPDPDHTRP